MYININFYIFMSRFSEGLILDRQRRQKPLDTEYDIVLPNPPRIPNHHFQQDQPQYRQQNGFNPKVVLALLVVLLLGFFSDSEC